jgi:hypothetical protein
MLVGSVRRRLIYVEVRIVADRRVTGTGKSSDGVITSLCGSWGEETKASAIAHIEAGLHRYFTDASGVTADVVVVQGEDGKYLRTDPDKSLADNLGDLPGC